MILTVSEQSGLCDSICSILNILGMPSYGCGECEALKERSDLYSTILLPEPYCIAEIHKTIELLRSHFPRARIYKIGIPDTEEVGLFDSVLYPRSGWETATDMLEELLVSTESSQRYTLGKITAKRNEEVKIEDRILPLTRTEGMILRCLIAASPIHLSKDELLKYCLKPGSYTEVAAIRTHICAINKKSRNLGYEALIIGEDNGYTINKAFLNRV